MSELDERGVEQRAEDLLAGFDWHYEDCQEGAEIMDYCDCSSTLVRELLDAQSSTPEAKLEPVKQLNRGLAQALDVAEAALTEALRERDEVATLLAEGALAVADQRERAECLRDDYDASQMRLHRAEAALVTEQAAHAADEERHQSYRQTALQELASARAERDALARERTAMYAVWESESEQLRALTQALAERDGLREALEECVATAADCRANLTPIGGYKDLLPDPTYRRVWDASYNAEQKAFAALDDAAATAPNTKDGEG